MIFWRQNKNQGQQDGEKAEGRLVHPPHAPEISLPTEEIKVEVDRDAHLSESDILDQTKPVPVPHHVLSEDIKEQEDLKDHSSEGGWLSRLTMGLSKSAHRLGQGITDVFTKQKLDSGSLQDLEDILITADMGVTTSAYLVKKLSERRFDKATTPEQIKHFLAEDITNILSPVSQKLEITRPDRGPFVILVCGVNGAGKTTTIGKLAYQWHMKEHRKVMIAAGDTFRAAAVDQLEVWAKRAHVPLVKKEIGADSASVAFESYDQAVREGADILMIDTAGRLQNKSNLMAELQKVYRALKKQNPGAPHAVLLVLDATTGQNAHAQVKIFKEAVDVTGLIMTKLDGSARGGVVVSLAQTFGLPIHAVGVGENPEDLSPFQAKDFALALLGQN